MSNSRIISVEMKDGILSIGIECKHGTLFAMQTLTDTDVIAVRYMVEEIQKDKFATIDLRYNEVESVEVEK